jgi:hypothetical protein
MINAEMVKTEKLKPESALSACWLFRLGQLFSVSEFQLLTFDSKSGFSVSKFQLSDFPG